MPFDPFIIALASKVFLREPLPLRTVLAILVGFGGVVIALDPAALIASSASPVGYLAAFGGVLLFAVSQLMLRRMADTETPECMIFAVFALISVIGAVLSLPHFVMPTVPVLGILLFSAVVDIAGSLCMAWAMQIGPTATVSSFHYSQLITGALFGYLIWHDVPAWNLIVGAGVIIASGLYIAHHARAKVVDAEPF